MAMVAPPIPIVRDAPRQALRSDRRRTSPPARITAPVYPVVRGPPPDTAAMMVTDALINV
jgi:hypothetical protein